jgi:hypothetical protein
LELTNPAILRAGTQDDFFMDATLELLNDKDAFRNFVHTKRTVFGYSLADWFYLVTAPTVAFPVRTYLSARNFGYCLGLLVERTDNPDLIKMGNVDEIRKSVSQSFEQRMAEDAAKHKAEMDEMWGVVRDSQVRGIFDSSTFLREKTTLPPDIAYSFFGNKFKVERGENGLQTVPLDSQGNPLLSRVNPGAYATPDEALEHYVQNYPQRDVFLRSPAGGPGTQGGKGDMSKNTISRAEFDKLDPAAKVAFMKDGKGAVTD